LKSFESEYNKIEVLERTYGFIKIRILSDTYSVGGFFGFMEKQVYD